MTQNAHVLAPPRGLTAFRLVNSAHSPIAQGSVLSSSQASNVKLGVGIYFAETEQDAVQFFLSHHGYAYTHFLECELATITQTDFFDLVAQPNEIRKFNVAWTWAGGAHAIGDAFAKAHAKRLALHHDFATAQEKKGLRWAYPGGAWTELVLHEPHCLNTVTVRTATPLGAWKYKHRLPPSPPRCEIADAAYIRWRERGEVHGRDVEDWLESERQLWSQ